MFKPNEDTLKNKDYCVDQKNVNTTWTLKNIYQFKKYNNSLRVPFAIYADFESMLQKIKTCNPEDISSYTNHYQKHVSYNFFFMLNILMRIMIFK